MTRVHGRVRALGVNGNMPQVLQRGNLRKPLSPQFQVGYDFDIAYYCYYIIGPWLPQFGGKSRVLSGVDMTGRRRVDLEKDDEKWNAAHLTKEETLRFCQG